MHRFQIEKLNYRMKYVCWKSLVKRIKIKMLKKKTHSVLNV